MADNRRPVLWSLEAQADLSEIWTYHAEVAGSKIADKVVRMIGEACRTLEQYPLAGRARDEIRPRLRSIPASPHVIYYRIQNDTAEIVRVLHGSRDVDDIFPADEV